MNWTRLWIVPVLIGAGSGCLPNDGTQMTPPGSSGGGAIAAGASGTAAGAPAAFDGLTNCEARDPSMTGAALHEAAREVLAVAGPNPDGVVGPCGFGSCHLSDSGMTPKAGLSLKGLMNLQALVNMPSCESALPLVAPGGGDAALNGSWLWLKLVAKANATDGSLMPQPSWGPGNVTKCGDLGGTQFGLRMPLTRTDEKLDEKRLGMVRRWICAGGPGPS